MNASATSPQDLTSERECFSNLCDMLTTNEMLQDLRIGFTHRPDYETIQDCLDVAKAHHLRCWFTGKGVVIERRTWSSF